MKSKEIDKGWVIASMNGTFIFPYTFRRTRKESIKSWMDIWDDRTHSWRKFKREGLKCVRSKQTTEIE